MVLARVQYRVLGYNVTLCELQGPFNKWNEPQTHGQSLFTGPSPKLQTLQEDCWSQIKTNTRPLCNW